MLFKQRSGAAALIAVMGAHPDAGLAAEPVKDSSAPQGVDAPQAPSANAGVTMSSDDSVLAQRVARLEREIASLRSMATSVPSSARVDDSRWTVGAYGELIGSMKFYHPDPNKASVPYRQSTLDLARVSFFVNNKISETFSFNSEIEFEHGGTGATREVEWDEFGEFETEIEKGGEVNLEQAYIEARLPNAFVVRGGHLLVPIGVTTAYHLPTMFSGVHRPESEQHLVPVVWHESGLELQWRSDDWSLRIQAATGLDSTGFSSQRWISGGTQTAFETPLINDLGIAFQAEYSGFNGTLLGIAGYTSGATHNRPKREIDDVDARVYIGDVHVRGQYGPMRVRGLGMIGTIANASAINAANASLSNALGAPRTPVGSAAYAIWVEATLDVLAAARVNSRQRADVFARYDAYDTMWKNASGSDNPLLQRQVLTVGINYFPHPRVVLKAEYLSRWINQGDAWGLHQDEASAALGFVL